MDLLYNLRDRLEDLAAAGTDAVSEDFRLVGAVEAFAELASDGGMGGRIYREVCALMTALPEERPALLLDTLDTVRAAVRENGETFVWGELVPLKSRPGREANAPYSRLRPLIAALQSGGSARISILEEYWAEDPEYFGDSRVLPYLAAALGDTHEEMEELFAAVLTKQVMRAVPFLKDGFRPDCPDGRREMERRVYWVARLAGAEENAWLLSILPKCERELREAVIAALGVSQDNAELLYELYSSETGKSRDAALRALARMEDEGSRSLWAEELERRPDCPPCLEGVDSVLAADMAAQALHSAYAEALERGKQELTQAEMLTLSHTVYAAYGKYSEKLREEWGWLAEHMPEFDAMRPDKNVKQWDMTAAELLEKCLLETVLWNPSENVRALASELGEKYPNFFLSAAVLTDLIMCPGEAFARYGKFVVKNGILHKENASERANRVQIMCALAAIRNDKDNGRHIPFSRKDALNGAPAGMRYRLEQLDPRWAETLSNPKVNQDGAVFDLKSAWSMSKLMFQLEWIE